MAAAATAIGPQGLGEIVVAMTLVAVAHAELDAEIDGDADEQHGEGDGDRVERTDHADGEGRGRDQPDDERGHDRREQAQRAQRKEQPQAEEPDRQHRRAHRALAQRGELRVRQRHRPGDAHAHAVLRCEPELARCLMNDGRRPRAGLESSVVEDRLCQNEAAELQGLRLPVGEEGLP